MYRRTTAPFFCSTKQLSFFWWSRERVKGMGQAGLRRQSVMTRLINSLPLSSATALPLELPEGEGEARVDVLEGVEGPAAGLVEEGIQGNPA